MIKIFFLFLLFFSKICFSYPIYPPIGSQADSLIGKDFSFTSFYSKPYFFSSISSNLNFLDFTPFRSVYFLENGDLVYYSLYDALVKLTHLPVVFYDKTFFHIIGWYTFEYKSIDVAGFQYRFYYWYEGQYTFPALYNCHDGNPPFFIASKLISQTSGDQPHSICASDWSSDPEMCLGINTGVSYTSSLLAACLKSDLPISQKTLIETTSLISESNSKHGLVAGGTAAQTGLLNEILNTFLSLLTKISGAFGTGDFSGNSEEDNSFIDFLNRDSSRNVAEIQPLVSSSGSSCPAPILVSFLGRSSEFSYQPTCDFVTRIRPIVVNAARVAAAWILIGAAL